VTALIGGDLAFRSNLNSDHDVDLRQVAGVLWRQRRIVIGATLIGAALGIAASLMSTRYVTEGLFLLDVPVDRYKRYEPVLLSSPQFKRFLPQVESSATELEPLRPLAENQALLVKALKPEFSFTDKDAKAFGVKIEQPGSVVGIRLRTEVRKPAGASPVSLLGEYVRDTVIRIDMSDSLKAQCVDNRNRALKLRNEQISSDFAIRQEQKREATLKDIIARRPESANTGNRQIVAVEKGTERFLPAAAQLTAAEILIADLKLNEARRERELIASSIRRDYYCRAEKSLEAVPGGVAFINGLKDIQASVFADDDKQVDVVEQTWNEIDLEREGWRDAYLSRMRFVVSPEGMEFRERKPGLVLGLVLGTVLGGILGLLLGLVVGWWRIDNPMSTTSGNHV
jgi:hypothetical protein